MKKILYLFAFFGLFFLIPSNTLAADIPAGARVFNGHTYYLYDTGGTWEEAKRACEDKGGHLVTITSPQEQEFIEGLVGSGGKNSYWMGSKRTNGEFSSWITGEPFEYTNFDYNEPYNKNNNENVLVIYRLPNPMVLHSLPYRWNDLKEDGTCDSEPFFGPENVGFICEWDSGSTPSQPSNPYNGINVYRVYTPVNGEHMFTTDYYEVQVLAGRGWSYEGVAWVAPTSGIPVYRLYSSVTTAHLYTSDLHEVNILQGQGWSVDNNFTPMFYSGGNGNVYRLYNPGLRQHMLTTSSDEYNQLGRNGWNQEGIGFYCQ